MKRTRLWVFLPCFLCLHFVPVEHGFKFPGDWPRIPFYVNPSIPGERIGGTDALMNSMRVAAKVWSSDTTNVRFDFRVSGFIDRSVPFAPASLNCSPENIATFAGAQKAVFATANETPDCTGVACTYVWSCEGNPVISHFDIVLNASGHSFATANHQGNDYDVGTVVARSLGHIAGLDYCASGLTPEQCSARIADGQSDPPPGALMHRLLSSGPYGVLAGDDLNGIRSLYQVVTPDDVARRLEARAFLEHVDELCAQSGCALPELETSAAYQLTQAERSDMLEHDTRLLQEGFADVIQRLGTVKYDEMLHDEGRAYPESAEKYLRNALDKRAEIAGRMENDRLFATRQVITVQIKQKQAELDEFASQVDSNYLDFMRADLKSMILIRKAIIDEQNRR